MYKRQDIYYQGTIKKELPVGISVSYQLDGKTISAAELAGKSGHVNIRFDYDNRQFETVDIDGSQEKIYVPCLLYTSMQESPKEISGFINQLITNTLKNII